MEDLLKLSQEPAKSDEKCSHQPGKIRLGSDCSGLSSDFLALKLLGCDVVPIFCTEICQEKIKLMSVMHAKFGHSPQIMGDITSRDVDSMPYVDVFVSGAPCPAYSSCGKKKALSDARGAIILHSLHYAVCKRPRVLVLENVKGLSSKKNEKILQNIFKILRQCGYSVASELVDTAQHGVPHSRNRIYIAARRDFGVGLLTLIFLVCFKFHYLNQVAMLKDERVEKFRFPTPVPMPDVKKFLVNNVIQKDSLSKCNSNVLEHLQGKATGVKGYVFMDLMSSAQFSSISEGKCPCITRACLGLYYFLGQNLLFFWVFTIFVMFMKITLCLLPSRRGKQGGFWIYNLKRWTNIYELAAFQGWPKSWTDDLLQEAPASTVGGALGDGMSLNVLMRVLGEALYCGGLLESRPEDIWAQIPHKANVSLPNELYKKDSHSSKAVWT